MRVAGDEGGKSTVFGELHSGIEEIPIFPSPLNCTVKKLPLNLHLEVINL